MDVSVKQRGGEPGRCHLRPLRMVLEVPRNRASRPRDHLQRGNLTYNRRPCRRRTFSSSRLYHLLFPRSVPKCSPTKMCGSPADIETASVTDLKFSNQTQSMMKRHDNRSRRFFFFKKKSNDPGFDAVAPRRVTAPSSSVP